MGPAASTSTTTTTTTVVARNGNDSSSSSSTTTRGGRYHGDTLWGNAFVQGSANGLASYHFAAAVSGSADGGEGGGFGAHISYENHRCVAWGCLDDGSYPVPSSVPRRRMGRGQSDLPRKHLLVSGLRHDLA